jgi:hypothetical protein
MEILQHVLKNAVSVLAKYVLLVLALHVSRMKGLIRQLVFP